MREKCWRALDVPVLPFFREKVDFCVAWEETAVAVDVSHFAFEGPAVAVDELAAAIVGGAVAVAGRAAAVSSTTSRAGSRPGDDGGEDEDCDKRLLLGHNDGWDSSWGNEFSWTEFSKSTSMQSSTTILSSIPVASEGQNRI